MSATDGQNRSPGLPADGAGLYAIVYISTAARALSADELAHLCSRAQARNAEEGVTGVLLYSDGAFMQYLEGPACGLSRVYGFIKTDPLHYGLIDLFREPISAREFAAWSMVVRDVGSLGQSSASQQYSQLAGQPGAPAVPRSAARELLLGFWGRGKNCVASALLDFSNQRARRRAPIPAT